MELVQPGEEERGFGEFRRKVRDSELLSASLEKLFSAIILRAGSAWSSRTDGC